VLQGDGINEAIEWLSARMKEQYGLQLDEDVKDQLQHLPAHLRVTVFQAVREALFNVVKHSGVLKAHITLEKFDGRGRVTIRDTGHGFDSQAVMANPQAAHGLMIVRDRLNLMGGKLDVQSLPGNGTQVQIDFPLDKSGT
jgi:signal transduction histidine kinase